MKNCITPSFLSDFVTLRGETSYNLRTNSDFKAYNPRSVHKGTESLCYLGPKIWEIVPSYIKDSPNLVSFKIQKSCQKLLLYLNRSS